MDMQGVDYAWWRPSSQAELTPFGFVIRYLSPDPTKNLTLEEAIQLTKWGKFIVCNWESDGLGGDFNRGAQDARDAIAQAVACGKPDGYPIYFSIDENVDPAVQDQYLAGIRSVLPVYEIGDYGEALLVQHWAVVGVTHGWRTAATSWAGGPSTADCALVQTGTAFNGNADADYSLSDEPTVFGGWQVGGSPLRPVTPVPPTIEEVDMFFIIYVTDAPEIYAMSGGRIWHISSPAMLLEWEKTPNLVKRVVDATELKSMIATMVPAPTFRVTAG